MLIDNQLLQPCYQGDVDGTAEQWWPLPHIPQSMRTFVGSCSGPALHQSQRLCLGCRTLRETSPNKNCHLHPQKLTAFRYEAGCVNSVYVCGKVCPCGESVLVCSQEATLHYFCDKMLRDTFSTSSVSTPVLSWDQQKQFISWQIT